MTTKEYLTQIRRADIHIQQLVKEIKEMKESITVLSGIDYTRDKIQTSFSDMNYTQCVEKYVDMERDINKEIDRYIDMKHKIISEIQSLSKIEYTELLYMRYVNYMSFEEIARKLHYSYHHLIYLHGMALQAFEKLRNYS